MPAADRDHQESQEKRIAVSLTADQTARLRQAGADAGLSQGLVARGLIEYGLDHIGDEGVQAAIREVKRADRERRSRVGRRVMNERWDNTDEGETQ